jgi:hypothetical protein
MKTKNSKSTGGIKGFLQRAGKSFQVGGLLAKDWGFWLAKKSGRIGFILATTSMVVLMPLMLEIGREAQVRRNSHRLKKETRHNMYSFSCLFIIVCVFQMLEVERSQVKDLRSQGYADRQLQEMGFSDSALHSPSVALKK